MILESDCQTLVYAIHSEVRLVSPSGLLVNDCKELLQESNGMSIYFIKRSANTVARYLAREACFSPDCNYTKNMLLLHCPCAPVIFPVNEIFIFWYQKKKVIII